MAMPRAGGYLISDSLNETHELGEAYRTPSVIAK